MIIDIYHRRAKYNLIHAQLNIKYYLQSIKLAACYVYCYMIIHLLDFKCTSDGYVYIAVVKNTCITVIRGDFYNNVGLS